MPSRRRHHRSVVLAWPIAFVVAGYLRRRRSQRRARVGRRTCTPASITAAAPRVIGEAPKRAPQTLRGGAPKGSAGAPPRARRKPALERPRDRFLLPDAGQVRRTGRRRSAVVRAWALEARTVGMQASDRSTSADANSERARGPKVRSHAARLTDWRRPPRRSSPVPPRRSPPPWRLPDHAYKRKVEHPPSLHGAEPPGARMLSAALRR
jgi:hypothetical protein